MVLIHTLLKLVKFGLLFGDKSMSHIMLVILSHFQE